MTDYEKAFQAEKAAAAPFRTSTTTIQGLDQVIAISEDSINAVLASRFNNQLKRKKDKRLREFIHALPRYGTINAKLSAPKIKMDVTDAPTSVYFYLNFESGNFDYWTGFGPDAERHTAKIDGWAIAFKTTFGLSKLSAVPSDIAEKITLLKPGSYSASQLILGFSAAATAELVWTSSKCPGLETDKDLQFASQNMFKTYMDIYIEWLSAGPFSVLGYVIKVEDKSAITGLAAPSFPPHKVKLSIQKYTPKTDDFKSKIPERAGLDCFLFQEMCEDEVFPEDRTPAQSTYNPATAGNWIIGDIAASLTMSKRVFWQRYLMEKFSLMNMQCINLANDAFHWVDKRETGTGKDWKLTNEAKPTSASWVASATGATYDWTGRFYESNNSILGGQWSNEWNTVVKNEMNWKEGSDSIDVSVKITQKIKHWTGGHRGGTDTITGGDTTISWKATITLGTIKDGGLDVKVNYATPELSYKYSSTNDFWDWGGSLKASYEKTAVDSLKQGTNFTTMQEDMTKALNGQASFVFPAGGDFFMKNPMFNKEGDLLVELSYVSKEIAIDEDFHLKVAAEKIPEINGRWLKVESSSDNSSVVLVKDKKDATLFQLDNGNLVVDNAGLPTGSHAIKRTVDSTTSVQDLRFLTKDTFDKQKESTPDFVKMEFSTTGSKFAYSIDKGQNFKDYFALDVTSESKIEFYVGGVSKPDPYQIFSLEAIY